MPDSHVNCSRVSRRLAVRSFDGLLYARRAELKSISRPRNPSAQLEIERTRKSCPVSVERVQRPLRFSPLATSGSSFPVSPVSPSRYFPPSFLPCFAAGRLGQGIQGSRYIQRSSPLAAVTSVSAIILTFFPRGVLLYSFPPISCLCSILRHDLLYFYKFPPYRCVTLRFVLHCAGKELPVWFGSVRGSSYRSPLLQTDGCIGGRPTGWIATRCSRSFSRGLFFSPLGSSPDDSPPVQEQNGRVYRLPFLSVGHFRDRSVVLSIRSVHSSRLGR